MEGEKLYREEVRKVVEWHSDNNLMLNVAKFKELLIDFRKHSADLLQLYINGFRVERFSIFKFLGFLFPRLYPGRPSLRRYEKGSAAIAFSECTQEKWSCW